MAGFQKELADILESVPQGVIVIDLENQNGHISYANMAAHQMYGYAPNELAGTPLAILGPHYHPDPLAARIETVSSGVTYRGVFHNQRKDGATFPVEVVERMLTVGSRPFLLAFHSDISLRRAAEEKSRRSEERLVRAQAIAHVGDWEIDLQTRMLWGSVEALRIYGFNSENQMLPLAQVQASVLTEDRPMLDRALHILVTEGGAYDVEFRIRRTPDGTLRTIHSRAERLVSPDGVPLKIAGVIQDVTERAETREALEAHVMEKEVLLRELYHRTKNNMGVICAMLSLRATQVPDEEMQRILHETEHRIRAMALVHQKLYQSKDLSRIHLREYVVELSALAMRGWASDPDRVRLQLDVEEIEVSIDIAIPCGIILNELFANAFKHAFPDGRHGEINVLLRRAGDGELMLLFSDDGVGVAGGIDIRNAGTLGIQTIVGIAEGQLQGSANVVTHHGVRWEMRLRENIYGQRL